MSITLLQQVKDANKSFIAGAPRSLNASEEPFVVVACIDPRLTCLLEPAMGLPRNRAIIIRTAGNKICAEDRGMQRSIAAGLFLKHAKEIFVVGHTDCALSKFSAADAIESFRRSGVPRSAFGDEDLRFWFGAFSDVKASVVDGIRYLRRSGLVASGIKTHGLVMDTGTGALEVVWDGDISHLEEPAPKPQEEPAPPPPATPATPAQEVASKRPIVIGERGQPAQQMSMRDVTAALKTLVARERGRAEFQRGMIELMGALREKKPARILSVLDRMISRYESQYPDLRPALEALRAGIESKDQPGLNYIELLKMAFE